MKDSNTHRSQKSDKIQDITFITISFRDNNEIVNFIFDTLPVGVIILNRKIDIVYRNKQASLFLSRFEIPEEIPSVGEESSMLLIGKVSGVIPGRDHNNKRSLKVHRATGFLRFAMPVNSQPVIVIFIIEDKISNKLNVE